MKKIGLLTSGGDSPGMNAAIRAVVRSAIYHDFAVYGIKHGYEGLIDGNFEEMKGHTVSDIMQRGGTILHTARSQRFMAEDGKIKAVNVLNTLNIDTLVVIGGEGSMCGAIELKKRGVNIIFLPGTIDNDLAYTDLTIGFDTALNTVLAAMGNIRDTSSSHERTTIVEVMGRHCGDIALYAGIACGAESILIPEQAYDLNEIAAKILQNRKTGKTHNIIVKSEGIDMSTQDLAAEIMNRTGFETSIVTLGYIQRGGAPTALDRLLASKMGYEAVSLIKNNIGNKAIAVNNGKIAHYGLEEAALMENSSRIEEIKLAETLAI